MFKSKKSRVISRTETGFLLVAKPFWQDDYKKSVILVIEHDPEGATGIILNKKSNLDISQALSEINTKETLYYGGPFNRNAIMFLHTREEIHDTIPLGNGLFIGGDQDELMIAVHNGILKKGNLRFIAGMVQWDKGQLEQEIKEDKWWISEMGPEYFLMNTDELWADKVEESDSIFWMFEDVPEPSLN